MPREVDLESLELALLARAGGASVVLSPGMALPDVLDDGFLGTVRVVGPNDATLLVLLAEGVADRETVLAEAASIAEVCLSVSCSRFTNLVPKSDGSEHAIETALQSLAQAAGVTLPSPSRARLDAVLALLRQKNPDATLYTRVLRAGLSYHTADSRDFRTGHRPGPMLHARSASLISRSTAVRPATMPDPRGIEPKARALFEDLEAWARRPIRAAFVSDESGRLEPLQLMPSKRVGACSFSLAADLLSRGALPIEELRAVLDEGDIAAAAPLDLELEGAEILAKGLGAGPGTAGGLACFTHGEALELTRRGEPAILFVHEVTRDDADVLRLVRGVVTVRGGLTGEAAIMSRALSKPCIASGATMTLVQGEVRTTTGRTIRHRDPVTLDGKAGLVVAGHVARTLRGLPSDVMQVLNELPTRGVFIRATHEADLRTAVNLCGEGVVVAPDDAALRVAAIALGLHVHDGTAADGSCVQAEDGAWICDPDAVLRARLRAIQPG